MGVEWGERKAIIKYSPVDTGLYLVENRFVLAMIRKVTNDEVDNSVGKDRNDNTDNRVENRIFSCFNLFLITTRDCVANTTNHQHDDRDSTDDIEQDICDLLEETTVLTVAIASVKET